MTKEEITTYAITAAVGIAALATLGEWIHSRRTKRTGRLAFGASGRPRSWTAATPLLRILALAAAAWSLVTLIGFNGLVRDRDRGDDVRHHVMVMLDASPSMQIADAGPEGNQRRCVRAAEVLQSILNRIPSDDVRFSVCNFYTEARMVAKECRDRELVSYFAADVPFVITYRPGKTDILKSLNQAGEFMKDWERKSATLIVLSDGDSVASTGLKPMPSAVSDVVFVGIGNPNRGSAINGIVSRQDGSSLSQLARRLGGTYFDANLHNVPSSALSGINDTSANGSKWKADRRQLAIISLGASAAILCLLPLLLHLMGSSWKPMTPAAIRKLQQKGAAA